MTSIKGNDTISRHIILEHYSHPTQKGDTDVFEQKLRIKAKGCIDDITIGIEQDHNQIISTKFSGVGCAITTAATDILLTLIHKKNPIEVKEILEEYFKMTSGEKYNEELLGELNCLSTVKNHPIRIKCAQLPANILVKLLRIEFNNG